MSQENGIRAKLSFLRTKREKAQRGAHRGTGVSAPVYNDDAERLIAEIRDVCGQIQDMEALFDLESDPDLIDSSIYQMQALQSRYRYLLRLAQEKKISGGVVPVQMSEFS